MGPHESPTRTASWSVQPLSQGKMALFFETRCIIEHIAWWCHAWLWGERSQDRLTRQSVAFLTTTTVIHTVFSTGCTHDTPPTLCLKNDTDVAHYNFNAHTPILVILAEMLLREYAIEWWFVIPPLLTHVSALSGETCTPEIVFSVTLGMHRDHPRRQFQMKFCMVGGVQEIVLRFEFYQNPLSAFRAVRGRSLPFPIDLAVFPPIWPNQWQRENFDPHSSVTA